MPSTFRNYLSRLGRPSVSAACAVALAVNTGYILWIILFYLDVLQIDLAGHMAGAMSLLRVGFHGYQDQFFQGYVQNLFYPPLEDILLASVYIVSGFNHLAAFKIYLVVITAAYSFSVWNLSRVFKTESARSVVLIVSIFLLNIDKIFLVRYQGLSFLDVLVTGLSSQMLAGIFFFSLIREVLGKKRVDRVGFLLAMTVLAHLVVGLVAGVLVGLFLVHEKDLKTTVRIGLWCLSTSFFVIPFILSYPYTAPSKLTIFDPWRLLAFALVGLVVFWRDSRIRILLSVASVLLFSVVLAGEPDQSSQAVWDLGKWLRSYLPIEAPPFHYYRFGMPALFLIVAATGLQIDQWCRIRRWRWRVPLLSYWLIGAIVVHGEVGGKLKRYSLRPPPALEALQAEKGSESGAWGGGEGIPRIWVIENSRPVDFGLESYLFLSGPQHFFSKGLLWESSRNNSLQASYLATLLGPPTILDYFYFYDYDCEARACLIDRMARDQGLQWMVYSSENGPRYLPQSVRACMREILQQGTQQIIFEPVSSIRIGRLRYRAYQLRPRSPQDERGLSFVEVIAPDQIKFYSDVGKSSYFSPLLEEYFGACVKKKERLSTVFIREEAKPALLSLLASSPQRQSISDQEVHGTRRSSGRYTITISGKDVPALVRIKLNYFPGIRLRNQSGLELPIFEGLSGMLTYGVGTISVDYERPRSFYLAYLLSLAAVGILSFGRAARHTA